MLCRMRQSLLLKTISTYLAEIEKHDRFIKLDDNHVAIITVNPYGGRRDDNLPDPVAMLEYYARHEDKRGDRVTVEWNGAELDDLPSAVLMRVVELKGTLERWNKDELDDLPPSTSEDVRLLNEERPRRRRPLRRYY